MYVFSMVFVLIFLVKFTEQALVHANSQISYLNAKFSSRSSASISQLKEDLYSDLTGLLIRDVKLESKKTVFDCLQTGRNGSKYCSHFYYYVNIYSASF